MALRALIVDDSQAYLAAARRVLEGEGMDVVGTASTTSEALALATDLRPEVVLVDLVLGPESGLDVAQVLAKGGWPVILISTYAEADFADDIGGSPAIGFVAKADLSAEAISALMARVADGAEKG
jgi:DNA-binding NarL/FixJ family response regulator